MVSAGVVVNVAIVVVPGVPDVGDLFKGFRLFRVHTLNQVCVHLFAVTHTLRRDLQGFVEKVVAACDDVDEVADAPRRVRRTVKVDVYAA